jgi:hypothetical protein
MLFICSQNKWRSPSAEALFAQVNGVSESFGAALHPANRADATTTLNILVGRGAGTEWHRDANPVSSLLFATSLQPDNGGEFQFRPSDGQLCEIRPRAGVFSASTDHANIMSPT